MGKKKKPLVPKVMEIPASQNKETTTGIPGKIRTCAYCRVLPIQKNKKQAITAKSNSTPTILRKIASWLYVGIYADKGISGKSALKRPQFLKMIKDCEDGKMI